MKIEDVFTGIQNKNTVLTKISDPSENQIFDLIQHLNIKSYNFSLVVDELLINSQEHGGTNFDFYYADTLDTLFIAIIDFGPGIHTTLPKNSRLSDIKNKSSTAIIRLAMEEGISGTAIVGRGMGLSILSKFVAEKDAEAIVACNSGMLKQVGEDFFEKKLAFEIVGTCIIIKVRKEDLGI